MDRKIKEFSGEKNSEVSFSDWKGKIEWLLARENILKVIEGSLDDDDGGDERERKLVFYAVRANLTGTARDWFERTYNDNVEDPTTKDRAVKKTWAEFVQHFDVTSRISHYEMEREQYYYDYETDFHDYVRKTEQLFNKIRKVKGDYDGVRFMMNIYVNMPASWKADCKHNTFDSALKDADYGLSQLLTELTRISQRRETREGQGSKEDPIVLGLYRPVGRGHARDKEACTKCGRTNHATKDCKIGATECWYCGKKGHVERACMKKKKDRSKKDEVASVDDEENTVASVADGQEQQARSGSADFLLDTGSSCDIVNDISLLIDPKPYLKTFKVANKSALQVTHVGKLRMQVMSLNGKESTLQLENVYYSADATGNILSVGDEKPSAFGKTYALLSRNNVQALGYRQGKHWFLRGYPQRQKRDAINGIGSSHWHRILGHCNITTLHDQLRLN